MKFVPIRIRFYIGRGEWSTNVDRLILLRSSPFTHVEFTFFSDGKSFSSSIRKDLSGKSEGVRLKMINYSHPERWHDTILWVTEAEEAQMRIVAEVMSALGIKYDLRAIAGFLITGRHNPRKYFCSEVVYALLAVCFLLPGMNHKMSPVDLEKVVAQLAKVLLARKEAYDIQMTGDLK